MRSSRRSRASSARRRPSIDRGTSTPPAAAPFLSSARDKRALRRVAQAPVAAAASEPALSDDLRHSARLAPLARTHDSAASSSVVAPPCTSSSSGAHGTAGKRSRSFSAELSIGASLEQQQAGIVMAAEADGGEVRSARAASEALLRRFLYAARPDTVLSDNNLEDVAVQASPSLELRFANARGAEASWTFEVACKSPKYLTEIFLSLEDYEENFTIESILSDYVTRERIGKPYLSIDADQSLSTENVNSYTITIRLTAHGVGTYSQDVIFAFNKGPVIRRKLCVDVHGPEDVERLENAHEYMRTLCPQPSDEDKPVIAFHSSCGPELNAKEKSVCQLYQKQSIANFFLTHTTLRFDDSQPRAYKRRMHELITIEEMAREEQISRQNAVVTMAVLGEINLGKVDAFVKYAPPGELFVQVPLVRDLTEDTKCGRLLLRSCNSLLLQEVIQDKRGVSRGPEKYEALIVEKCGNMIYARLSRTCVKRFRLRPGEFVRMYVEYVMNRTPMCDWRRAVDLLADSRIVHPMPNLDPALASAMPEWTDEWSFKGCQLNARQRQAVAAIMTPTNVRLPPLLILGPYGTGKTSTIAQALRILLINCPYSKVILCTHSNSAADLYIKDYFDVWYNETKDKRLQPMRIYYTGRMRNTVHQTVQKYCLFDTTGQFRDPTNEDLQKCQLIITTLGTASCLGGLEYSPSHVIVDEAAQAFECEALTCLVLANERTRLVLAGDQMQLAPEVYSDLCRERGLGVSILERIHKTYVEKHPCRVQLCINYRSHSDIVRLTSNLFYKDQIRPGSKILERSIYSPVSFFAVSGLAVPVSDATGYCNEREALEIVERVAHLKENWPEHIWGPFDENSICVLTHYAEQVFLIRKELRKRRFSEVSVERVLNVQGKQFAVVFVSVVRTRHCTSQATKCYKHDYGFLTDEKLMNTAITRAKHVIGVFGDPVGLVTSGTCKKQWQTYIDKAYIQGINLYDFSCEVVKQETQSEESDLNPRALEFVPRPSARVEFPYWVENVAMPVTYPVMHCVFRPAPL